MLKIVLIATLACTTVLAEGDFVVLHSPNSVEFTGEDSIDQSLLKDVFTGVLGYDVDPHSWDGVYITNSFNLPEAIVSIAIEGVESLRSPRGKRYPLNVDEVEETTWQAICRIVEDRDSNNTLIRIRVGDGVDVLGYSVLGELKVNPFNESSLKNLNLKNVEDKNFIEEIKLLRAFAQKIPSAITTNSRPDVFWFVVSGLRPVINRHGESSSATNEAYQLLNKALSDLSEAFMDAYNGKVIIATFTSDANKVQNTQSAGSSRIRRQEPQGGPNAATVKPSEGSVVSSMPQTEEPEKNEEVTVGEDESSKKNTNENLTDVEKFSESSIVNDVTELPGHELNYREPEVHSMTESGVIKKPLQIKDVNLSKRYSADYPVIFNIFLWFGVTFLFSLIAICIAIAEMDPGRDSIIYRMTSNRMKKDN